MKKISNDDLLNELKRRFNEKSQALEELQEITKELMLVNEKLTESEALKSHFISNITNEIINPFASILGLAKNIMSVPEKDWEKVRTMSKLIHDEAFNLDFQLKNIFAAAEIEAGEIIIQVANVNISELIQSVIESFSHLSEKKHITVNFKDELNEGTAKTWTHKTDPEKVQLVLFNLLDNAIKFSSATGKVEIVAWKEDANVIVSVQDFGVGISDEHQRIIFDRFLRIDSGINSLNRGHGLGLSVNKAIIDLMKGKIEVQSRKKHGSTFVTTFPELEVNSEISDYTSDGSQLFFGENEIF